MKKRILSLMVGFLLLSLLGVALVQAACPVTAENWHEVGPDSACTGGISNNTSESMYPSLAVAPDGTLYVTWDDESSGDSEIYVRRWNETTWEEVGAGSATGGGISDNTGGSVVPSLAVAPDNTPYVAWMDYGEFGQSEIYVRRWNETTWEEVGAGSASGGGISNNGGAAGSPSMAMDPNGTPYVAWVNKGEIYIRRWNGTTWEEVGAGSASGGGISNNASTSNSPSMAIASDGTPYIVWYDGTEIDYEIYVRQWNGTSWEEVGANSATNGGISNNSGDSRFPSIAIQPDGKPYVAWCDDSGGDQEIYIRRWNGTTWEEVGAGSASGGGISDNSAESIVPSLAVAPDGTFYLAWQDQESGDREIYVRRWNGTTWEEVGAGSASGGGISDNTGISWHPSIVITNDSRPYVAWSDKSGGDGEIYIRRWEGTLTPLLDLPVSYTSFSQSALGNMGGKGTGRVNSWLDHSSPNYGTNCNISLWTGEVYTSCLKTNVNTCITGRYCYDGHNGIDLQTTMLDEPVFAAAPGIVHSVIASNVGYGNQVWLDHRNGFATLYGHLKSIGVTQGETITDVKAKPLGIMGNSGNSTGTHLHFGVYFNTNSDGQWAEDEVVDPYGWFGSGADPWAVTSSYLWKEALWTTTSVGSIGGSITSPSQWINAFVPAGSLTSTLTIELWDEPPAAEPSAQLRSASRAFWLRVLEWLTGGSEMMAMASNSFAIPTTITATFSTTETLHLDKDHLVISQWNESSGTWVPLATSVDLGQQQAVAQTSEIGHFDLQAPLLCPSDTTEPDDSFYFATVISGTNPINRFLDVQQDKDWFRFPTVASKTYEISTTNLAGGVDTILELYAPDGLTLLASDDNSGGGLASRLEWQASADRTYFVRVLPGEGSATGCDASYNLAVSEKTHPGGNTYLPIILKNR